MGVLYVLEGRTAIVTGASGIVGSGICRRFLEEGANVIAPLRSEASRAELAEELLGLALRDGQLDTPIMDYSTAAGAAALAQHVHQRHGGGVDIVVASVGGGFKQGALSVLTPADFQDALARALPHMFLAQALFPLLKGQPSSCYIVCDGRLGEVCTMPNAAALSIANAAIYGIVRSLEAERREAPQRVVELRIAALIRKASKPGHPFVTGGTAYPATLIGDKAVEVAVGQQRSDIIRITSADLAACSPRVH